MALPAALQLVHVYPSSLNAAVTVVIALLAGGAPERAAFLGAAMLLLQFAIGAANDWADAAADAVARPGKPIVSGVVRRETAAQLAVLCAVAGLLVAARAGMGVLLVAGAGLFAGLAYDLRLKRTAWAWLPFAAGFVLLPLFAWLGAGGSLPGFGGWIVPLALPAGGAVSLANGLIDLEGDEGAGSSGPAVRLGRPGTLRVLFALHVLLVAGVALSLFAEGGAAPVVWVAVASAGALVGAGRLLAGRPQRRDRLNGWRVQAFGLALLAAAWFAGLALRS